MPNQAMTNMLMGYAAANEASSRVRAQQGENALKEAEAAETLAAANNKLREAKKLAKNARAAQRSPEDELKLKELTTLAATAEARAKILEEELAERDALIIEWMHSNDAFKKLASKYGSKLNISEEEQKHDRYEAILDIAEENPKFKNTRLVGKVKTLIGK